MPFPARPLLVLSLLLAALPAAAQSHEPLRCIPKPRLSSTLEQVTLTGAERDRFVERYNSDGEKTNFDPDTVLLTRYPGMQVWTILLLRDNCVIQHHEVSDATIQRLRG
ncbi:hypothetical protein [Oceanibaculum pacificum]|uniref:hypothetical protein n=1 Tax=Oceanibaculum pacificum TaxID=580166 RepID=UPI0012ECF803|nr:hypothetical protein [Oceanibaculum pacificum]